MKVLIIILSVFLTQCSSKNNISQGELLLNSTSKTNVGSGYEMKISKFVSDSRCPEGVNCIWIGQVEMKIAVYKGETLVEEKLIIVTSNTFEENRTWFSKYIKLPDMSITSIVITPNRVKDIEIKEDEYKLGIYFE
ncbi:hypothetical protein LXD69_05620 [Flavobacterium sediminilitoris]|uniref:Lipoprotein n=1 Tax=Flavobacterium sediminilitoris TaxID=2024526 RepID=A0ABY4HTU8_9FLAO|nr:MULTISPECIES: hypothetical protein [Flavobacterium]UOX34989.1 hypothetical protein LXD69_05620 [Flavobacterium sediminilitoris]